MPVDLDAPEHEMCSDALADRDARIRELNIGLARATSRAIDWRKNAEAAEAQRQRAQSLLSEVYSLLRANRIGDAVEALELFRWDGPPATSGGDT